MLLVDTSIWVPYFNGEISEKINALDYLLGQELILMGDLILAEVLQGFVQDDHYNAATQILGTLEMRSLGGIEIANSVSDNYRNLRNEGVAGIDVIDMFIATYCINNGVKLLHDEEHFLLLEEHLGLVGY